jgi:hypothetical protein
VNSLSPQYKAILSGHHSTEAANAVAKFMVPDSTKNVQHLASDETGWCRVGMVFTSALILTFSPGKKEQLLFLSVLSAGCPANSVM